MFPVAWSVCMMTAKVGKSDGEATFAGARGNDPDAPIPAVRRAAIEPPGSILSNRSSQRSRGQRLHGHFGGTCYPNLARSAVRLRLHVLAYNFVTSCALWGCPKTGGRGR